jgi:hypothetical protein
MYEIEAPFKVRESDRWDTPTQWVLCGSDGNAIEEYKTYYEAEVMAKLLNEAYKAGFEACFSPQAVVQNTFSTK